MAEAILKSDAQGKTELASRASAALGNIRSLGDLLELPIFRQLALLAGVALAVAAGLMMFFWSQSPGFMPVFPSLSPEDSAQLAEALRAGGIEVKIDPATGNVRVPQEMVHQARMRAAQAGLPSSSGTGFELLQEDQGFGTSQFIEGARYQLAIETELSRTISSLSPVRAARIHLALPKPSAFTQGRQPASASVLLDLHPGRTLDGGQVDAIEHLVASSVPNLSVESVSVVDQHGRLLSRRDDNPDGLQQTDEQYQYVRRIEADYAQRIRQLLTPMLGPNGVNAEVSAVVDFSKVEEASERYDAEPVLRSEQTAEETRSNGNREQGIPGALANQPPENNANAEVGAAQGAVTETSRQATRNFEVDRLVSHRRLATGGIDRLSVAVLVDYLMRPDAEGNLVPTPLSPEELAKVEALVRQAVGFSEQRGDSVTVQNAPFLVQGMEPPPEPPLWKRADLQSLARQGIGALIVLVLIFTVVRPLMRALISKAPRHEEDDDDVETEALTGETAALASSVAEQQAALAQPAGPSPEAIAAQNEYERRLTAAREAATQDPKQVAQVLKGWLHEDG